MLFYSWALHKKNTTAGTQMQSLICCQAFPPFAGAGALDFGLILLCSLRGFTFSEKLPSFA